MSTYLEHGLEIEIDYLEKMVNIYVVNEFTRIRLNLDLDFMDYWTVGTFITNKFSKPFPNIVAGEDETSIDTVAKEVLDETNYWLDNGGTEELLILLMR